jgi:hypothetical protein
MKNYHYQPELRYFIGESYAVESPREPGFYLTPAHATKIEPPECSLREIQIFNGESWDIIEDKRGTYYSTLTFEVIVNDNPLEVPENSTKEKPPEIAEGYILKWNDEWVLEEKPILTAKQKLENLGLSVEDLKDLLGISI